MPITRQDLAEMIGTTLETVSRIVSRWRREGIVEAGREQITITYPHRLVMIAEDLVSDHWPLTSGHWSLTTEVST